MSEDAAPAVTEHSADAVEVAETNGNTGINGTNGTNGTRKRAAVVVQQEVEAPDTDEGDEDEESGEEQDEDTDLLADLPDDTDVCILSLSCLLPRYIVLFD